MDSPGQKQRPLFRRHTYNEAHLASISASSYDAVRSLAPRPVLSEICRTPNCATVYLGLLRNSKTFRFETAARHSASKFIYGRTTERCNAKLLSKELHQLLLPRSTTSRFVGLISRIHVGAQHPTDRSSLSLASLAILVTRN